MKLITSIILAFAVSTQARRCNDGWGLPENTACPWDSYVHSYCCILSGEDPAFPTERLCAEPVRDGIFPQDRCNGVGNCRRYDPVVFLGRVNYTIHIEGFLCDSWREQDYCIKNTAVVLVIAIAKF
ncbi:hypothetical protein NX059_007393 [Plenodomus lindquistii]|nr:hypothetical protein NX059_007393 [Plenodomus lindquistii]